MKEISSLLLVLSSFFIIQLSAQTNLSSGPLGETIEIDVTENGGGLQFEVGPMISTTGVACATNDAQATFENDHYVRWELPAGPNVEFTGIDIEIIPDFGASTIVGAQMEAFIYIDETDDFPPGTLTPIASSGIVQITSEGTQTFHFSTIPSGVAQPGDVLIIEIHQFEFIGGAAQLGYGDSSGSGWILATDCGVPVPTQLSALVGSLDLVLVLHANAIAAEIVPTLGEWAVICLGMLMMIVGVVAVNQKSVAIA